MVKVFIKFKDKLYKNIIIADLLYNKVIVCMMMNSESLGK